MSLNVPIEAAFLKTFDTFEAGRCGPSPLVGGVRYEDIQDLLIFWMIFR